MDRRWRPKEWDYTHKDVPSELPIFNPHSLCDLLIYEAGADAMLEELFKLAKESPTKTFTIDSRVVQT